MNEFLSWIDDEVDAIKEQMASGADVASMEKYRELVGKIGGLRDAKRQALEIRDR